LTILIQPHLPNVTLPTTVRPGCVWCGGGKGGGVRTFFDSVFIDDVWYMSPRLVARAQRGFE